MITFKTNHGDIVISLDFDNVPRTAVNFLNYALTGFYKETLFHRVVKDFVIQGGGLSPDMHEKQTQPPIENEADLGTKNLRGSLSMARTSLPHSASSQFFINLKDNAFLDFKSKSREGWGYCVFGRVTKGMDVVDEIAKVKTTSRMGHQDVPEEPVIVEDVIVDESQLPEKVREAIQDSRDKAQGDE